MLPEPKRAVAVAVVMQSPKSWRYFGINEASLLVEPYAFMMVSGEAVAAGELAECFDAERSPFDSESDGEPLSVVPWRAVARFQD